MSRRLPFVLFASAAALVAVSLANVTGVRAAQSAQPPDPAAQFRTSQRCLVCHNNLKSSEGKDASIAAEWQASVMANAARDPYWQGSVRREVHDHPQASAAIQNQCATCHMPLAHLQDNAAHQQTGVFALLPLTVQNPHTAAAADGVTCTVCHQIQPAGLGTAAAANGNFSVAAPDLQPRPLFGPFAAPADRVLKIHTLASGYTLVQSSVIRQAALCASCHTLYTTAYGPGGKPIGRLPEQMTYLEWQHSSFQGRQTCQQCHMPAVQGTVAIASLLSQPYKGVRRHTFVGANFLLENILSAHHDELAVAASPAQLAAAAADTTAFLQSQAARLTVSPAQFSHGRLTFAVRVENLSGHKLPTAFPSRRAWLHVTITDAAGHAVFESGRLNPDGSIAGNANDQDPTRYSPHYATITAPDQVEIFEPILGDSQGRVTTGVLNATQYLKDNRILPAGFDKATAGPDIAVHGKAAGDPNFTAGSATTKYRVSTGSAAGPFTISAQLLYQPIGYRWAHNLAAYKADEPQSFVRDFEQAAAHSAVVLAHASSEAGK
ncbi:MAG TPA: hypothetical protein VFU55_07125 [Terracidiphilus sp.]|nr:hypothetical protein [Terracidiphilus sp.]